jgi:hypothetical protein
VDTANQVLAVEPADPNGSLTVTAGSNMGTANFSPLKAMTIAQRLLTALNAPQFEAILSAGGIGVGTTHDVNDISSMLDNITAEYRAQFDFYANLASNMAISGPIIDTVASFDGTITD